MVWSEDINRTKTKLIKGPRIKENGKIWSEDIYRTKTKLIKGTTESSSCAEVQIYVESDTSDDILVESIRSTVSLITVN